MAYTSKEWKSGETITADALNHLEQGVASASGFECVTEKTTTTYFDGEVNPGGYGMAPLDVQNPLPNQDLEVIFNGTTYTLPFDGESKWGAWSGSQPDFSKNPIGITNNSVNFVAVTNSAASYTLKIEVTEINESVVTTECFEKAVMKSVTLIGFVNHDDTGATVGFSGFTYADAVKFNKPAFLLDVNESYNTKEVYVLSSVNTDAPEPYLIFTTLLKNNINYQNGSYTVVEQDNERVYIITSNNEILARS